MEYSLYHYRAKVISIYDGDTIRLDIDLGLKTWIRNEPIRLARINAPELRGAERPAGIEARDFLRSLIQDKNVIIQTIKDDKGKYGRYIGEILLEKDGGWININDLMVQNGHAEYKEY
jgi:micrococcal nuclease